MLNKTMPLPLVVSVAMTALLLPATAHADSAMTSIRDATVYDTNNKVMSSTNKQSYAYASGKAICPIAKVVTKNGKTLTSKDFDFLTYYFRNRKPGVATAVIRGNHKRGYKDAIIVKYKISRGQSSGSNSSTSGSSSASGSGSLSSGNRASNALDLSKATAAAIPDQRYTGKALTPNVSLYYNGKKVLAKYYKVSYANNVAIGTATATVTGNGDVFQGTKSVSFNIVAATGSFKVGTIAAQKYTGNPLTPKPAVSAGNISLKEGTDYKLSYANNTAVGSATVTVTGIGRYVGFTPKSVTFTIAKQTSSTGSTNSLAMTNATVLMASRYYTTSLSAVTPSPTVKMGTKLLKKDRDYTISYKNNKKPGTATLVIKGKGKYSGSKNVSFTLVNIGDDLARAACKLSYSRAAYANASNSHKGGYYGTTQYIAAIKKHIPHYMSSFKGRACHQGMRTALTYSGYWKGSSGEDIDSAYNNNSTVRKAWVYIGTYAKAKSKLQPGDVLVTRSGYHTFMYVGKTIPQEVYRTSIKGKGKSKGDLGKPTSSTAWVSAHYAGGMSKSGSAALCMGSKSYALCFNRSKIYRCVKPKNTKYRAGKAL